jgi:hypothetical protein
MSDLAGNWFANNGEFDDNAARSDWLAERPDPDYPDARDIADIEAMRESHLETQIKEDRRKREGTWPE